jgi:hypothetical protein
VRVRGENENVAIHLNVGEREYEKYTKKNMRERGKRDKEKGKVSRVISVSNPGTTIGEV